jgi:MscS family membrane protein
MTVRCIGRRLKRVLFLAVFLAPELHAQLPLVPQKTPEVREESSDDPFGRSTPRGTVEGFIRAAEAEDYELAVNYLDTHLQGDLARELAQQLQAILNREASVDLHNLSTKPEGDLLHNRHPNRDLVGVAQTPSGSVVLWVERVQQGHNPPVWLFSEDTLRYVPEFYRNMASGPEIERRLPGWLSAKLLSRPLWLWSIALISIPLVLVLGSLFSRLLKPLLNAVANRFLGTTEIDSVRGLVGPLQIVLLGILVFIGSGSPTRS